MFGPFDLDPCATEKSAKCERYLTEEDNGLLHKWTGAVFCNPPYSDVGEWVEKGYYEVLHGNTDKVCMLVFSRTGTRWFQNFGIKGLLWFVPGRVKFLKNGEPSGSSPMPSVVIIFDKDTIKKESGQRTLFELNDHGFMESATRATTENRGEKR